MVAAQALEPAPEPAEVSVPDQQAEPALPQSLPSVRELPRRRDPRRSAAAGPAVVPQQRAPRSRPPRCAPRDPPARHWAWVRLRARDARLVPQLVLQPGLAEWSALPLATA